MNKKLLIFWAGLNFEQSTRRATFEAIGKLSKINVTVFCTFSYWKRKEANLKSDNLKIIPFYYFFPYKLISNYLLINTINFILNYIFIYRGYSNCKFVCFSSPLHAHLRFFFKNSNIIFILSDPYHLMGFKWKDVKSIIDKSVCIFSTSKKLIANYLPDYFGNVNARIYYWPNCVDLSMWHKTESEIINRNFSKIVGFAGNFMEVTDLDLLEFIIRDNDCNKFVLVGKINFIENSLEFKKMKTILSYQNVEYKGYVNYNDLPREIMGWDICIMIDKKNELASYHHHNKYYQYIALNKPVVYYRNHDDYDNIDNMTFGVDSYTDFSSKIKYLNQLSETQLLQHTKAVQLFLDNNSSTKRANLFLDILNEII